MPPAMLAQEFEYYILNKVDLVRKYAGLYIVIKDRKVVNVYNSSFDAYTASKEKFKSGTYLVQYCLPENEKDREKVFSKAFVA